MPTSRENYQIQANDLQGMLLRLNSVLARISDRLDKIEGLRDELETAGATFTGDITTDGNVIVNEEDAAIIHSRE